MQQNCRRELDLDLLIFFEACPLLKSSCSWEEQISLLVVTLIGDLALHVSNYRNYGSSCEKPTFTLNKPGYKQCSKTYRNRDWLAGGSEAQSRICRADPSNQCVIAARRLKSRGLFSAPFSY